MLTSVIYRWRDFMLCNKWKKVRWGRNAHETRHRESTQHAHTTDRGWWRSEERVRQGDNQCVYLLTYVGYTGTTTTCGGDSSASFDFLLVEVGGAPTYVYIWAPAAWWWLCGSNHSLVEFAVVCVSVSVGWSGIRTVVVEGTPFPSGWWGEREKGRKHRRRKYQSAQSLSVGKFDGYFSKVKFILKYFTIEHYWLVWFIN